MKKVSRYIIAISSAIIALSAIGIGAVAVRIPDTQPAITEQLPIEDNVLFETEQ